MIGHIFRGIIQLLGVLGVGLVLLSGVVAWQLSKAPISISFLTPYLEQALSAEDGAFSIRLDDTILAWTAETRSLEIRVIGGRAVGATGAVVAEVPDMSVSLSGSALLQGRISPRSLSVFGPVITLLRRADGRFQFGVDGPAGAAGKPTSGDIAQRLIADLLAPESARRILGDLNRITIIAGDLKVVDEALGLTWRAPAADIRFKRVGEVISIESILDVEIENHNATINLSGAFRTDRRDLNLLAEFEGVNPRVFSRLSPKLSALAALDAPVSGRLEARMTEGRIVGPVKFDLAAGAGAIDFGAPMAARVAFRSIRGKGAIEPAARKITVDEMTIDFGAGGRLKLPGFIDHEFPVRGIRLSGVLDGNAGKLEIKNLVADMLGPTLEANAVVRTIDGQTTISLSASARDFAVDDARRYWPAKAGPLTRTWVRKYIAAGEISRASIDLTARWSAETGLEILSLNGDLKAEGLTVDYLAPMPKAVGVKGHAKFDLKSFDITITGGGGNGLTVREGRILFSGLDQFDQFADIDLLIEGSLADALRLIDRPPLEFTSAVGLNPENTKGRTSARLKMLFLVEQGLTLDRIAVGATANIEGAFLPGIALGEDLSAGKFSLKVDKTGMDVVGGGRLGTMPVEVRWRENFGDGADFVSRFDLKATIGNDHRANLLGLNFAPFTEDYMSGPAVADITLTKFANGRDRMRAKFKLDGVRLALPSFGWEKPAGTAGTAEVELLLSGEKIAVIERVTLAAGDLGFEGSAALDQNGNLTKLDFSRFGFGRTSVAGALRSRPGGWDLDIRGAELDLGAWLRQANKADAEDNGVDRLLPPITISANIDRVHFSEDRFLGNVAGALDFDGKVWRAMSLTALLKDNRTVDINLAPADGGRSLTVVSDDAGALLRALDLYDDLVGGKLELKASFDDGRPGAPLSGKAVIRNYRVVKVPALARLLSIASLTGILEALTGEGLAFSVLEAPFVYVDGIAQVKDGRASGLSLGVTASGKLDTRAGRASMKGTVVPAYALNSVLGRVPLIGGLLTGGEKGGGVFAANYSLDGPIEKPDIRINPLSVLAPGILRRFFDIFDGAKRPPPPPGGENPPESSKP